MKDQSMPSLYMKALFFLIFTKFEVGKVGPRDPGLEEGQGLFATLHARVSYVGAPAAVFKIMDLGRGTLKAKFDLRHPYGLLLVNVDDRNFFGNALARPTLH